MRTLLTLFVLLPASAFAGPSALDADAVLPALPGADRHARVLDCMAANRPQGHFSARFVLTTHDAAGGQSRLAGAAYLSAGENGQRMLLRFTSPAHVAGVSYLIDDVADGNTVYVYLPTLGQPRQLTLHNQEQSILTTSLTASDLQQLIGMFNQSWMDYPGKLDERTVQRVNFLPRPDGNADDYRQLRTWVDDKTCLPLKARLQRKSGKEVIAHMDPDSMRRLGDGWAFSRATVVDESTGYRTDIELLEIKRSKQLPGKLFQPQGFYH